MGGNEFQIGWFSGVHGHGLRFGKLDALGKKARGVVLLLNGRSEFLEKYAQVALELSSRGYMVLSFDWRGQGLSVRELENRQKGYVKTFDDYLEDLCLFYKKVIKTFGLPVTLMAHSMGGHMALRFMHDNPDTVVRAILVSPMVDIVTHPFPSIVAQYLADIACTAGFGEFYVMGGTNYAPDKIPFKSNLLTHDLKQFKNEKKLIAATPDLALGDVTYAWLKAAFDSIQLLRTRGYAREIKTPVLLVSAGMDRVVSVVAQQRMARLMPNCKFVSIPNALHEILHETEDIRTKFWSLFDAFTAG